MTQLLDGLMFLDIVAGIELTTFYVSYKSLNHLSNYKIKKDFDTTDISKVVLPKKLKESIQNSEDINSDTFKKATIEFTSVLTNNFDDNALKNFYRNIKSIKIRDMHLFDHLKLNASGYYSLEQPENTIAVFKYISIFHELFHMASSYYDEKNKVSFYGFEVTCKTGNPKIFKTFGKALNEGYTDLLTERYFGDKYNVKNVYKKEMHIALHLEMIVGQKTMEKLYLTANQSGLINELKKYSSLDDILNLIDEVDKKRRNVKIIYSQLLEMYKNKVLLEVKNKVLTNDEASILLEDFEASIFGKLNFVKNQNITTLKKGFHY